jgi:hypothetical protein
LKIEPTVITSLEEIVQQAEREIESEFTLNYVTSSTISITDLKSKPIKDVTEEAILWAAKERPAELQINHGEYIKDGLDHVISELKHKKTSNRALFSLISRDDIVNTGDQPIPSFMIMQCNIHENVLYCTSYFRALEVSKFLRVNLEELRLKICNIYDEIPEFKSVNITIFAFRAYTNKKINTLRIPEIDRTHPIKLFTVLNTAPGEIAVMLREKSLASTVIQTESLKHLLEALDNGACTKFNTRLIRSNANDAIATAELLLKLRQKSSHHPDIEALNQTFHNHITAIAEELENE